MKGIVFLISAILMAAPVESGRQEFRTLNGLRVILDERHDRSVLRLFLLVGWDRSALSDLQADQFLSIRSTLSQCGAGGLSRPAFDRRLADQGLRLVFKGTGDSLSWSMLSDSQDQDDAFELLGHAVFRPALEDDLAPVGKAAAGKAKPEDLFRASLGFPSEGIAAKGLSTDESFAIHRRLVRPEQSVLVIQGDLSLAQARQSVMLHLGTWSPSIEKVIGAPRPSPPLELVQLKAGAGAGAWAGSPAPVGDARARAAHIAVAMLLSRRFREEIPRGITFEAFRPGGDSGPLLFGIGSEASDPRKHLRTVLEGLCRRGFEAGDLALVRSAWQTERAALALHPEDQLEAIARIALKGDPGDYLLDLSLEEINAALRARIDPAVLLWF
ncbi:MAG: hypothetical protein Q8O00_02040 [Holophaga sp.]|nr:hypothetical protein [Holophaga sp.]